MLTKAMILMLALCVAGIASSEQPFDDHHEWILNVELQVSGEDTECELVFDAIPEEYFFAQGGCCRVCSKGKACGNSCINRSRTCHQPRGCACDG